MKQLRIETKECTECGGAGRKPGSKVGAYLRKLRESVKISQREMAVQLEVAPEYLSKMEADLIGWTWAKVHLYQMGLRDLPKDKPAKKAKVSNGRKG